MIGVSKEKTIEEKRAALIIKYRNLKIDNEERAGDIITYYLSRDEEKFVMVCLIGQSTIGIAYIRDLKNLVDKVGAKKGIMVGSGKFTYSSKSSAPKLNVELIPPTIPVFDIFEHKLVPRAEIVKEEEKAGLEKEFHAHLYQFPWIKVTDPVAIILGAEPGDVIKIISDSETAGISSSYRYVV